MVVNRRIVLASRPLHEPTEDNFRLEQSDIDLNGSSLLEGEILVKSLWMSVDPYTRAAMGLPGNLPSPDPYPLPQFKDAKAILELGATFGGRSAGVVLKSKNEKVKEGDYVAADWKWQEYAIFNADKEITFEVLNKSIFSLEDEEGKVGISKSLGALGVSGSHAWFGLTHILFPSSSSSFSPSSSSPLSKNETLVVSSASGNIGIIVGQLGKINGVKTVGITSGSKAADLEKKGIYDIGIDYRAVNGDVAALSKKIKEAVPTGIDAYYDNTQGFISDAVWENLNPGARVYICGGIANYNNGATMAPYENARQKEGVTVKTGMDLFSIYLFKIPEARQNLVPHILAGKLKCYEHITTGFENVIKAFVGMYNGNNFGKAVVKL